MQNALIALRQAKAQVAAAREAVRLERASSMPNRRSWPTACPLRTTSSWRSAISSPRNWRKPRRATPSPRPGSRSTRPPESPSKPTTSAWTRRCAAGYPAIEYTTEPRQRGAVKELRMQHGAIMASFQPAITGGHRRSKTESIRIAAVLAALVYTTRHCGFRTAPTGSSQSRGLSGGGFQGGFTKGCPQRQFAIPPTSRRRWLPCRTSPTPRRRACAGCSCWPGPWLGAHVDTAGGQNG